MVQAVGNVIFGEDTRTLAEVQADTLVAVQAAKANALAAMTYTVGGVAYTVTLSVQDQVDVQTQLSALASAPAGTTVQWEIVDNVFLTWAAADVEALLEAGLAHIQAVYANTAALVSTVNAATSIAAVQAIDLTQGWPA